jgi:hypothetical protein
MTQHLWTHYEFTGDKEFLKTRAYPALKELVEYWEDFLVEGPGGKLITPAGWSPEHGPVKRAARIILQEGDRTPQPGASYDQQIVWDLFTNYIDASEELGIDAGYRAKVSSMRENLLGPKIGKWGQIQEWMQDVDDPKNKHRHVSHLFAVHPGRQINPVSTPELAAAAKVSLNARGDAGTGWSKAWKINFWARLADGNRAHRILKGLLAPSARAAAPTSICSTPTRRSRSMATSAPPPASPRCCSKAMSAGTASTDRSPPRPPGRLERRHHHRPPRPRRLQRRSRMAQRQIRQSDHHLDNRR